MARLKSLQPLVGNNLPPAARWPEKIADAFYNSKEWRALRLETLKRDGFKCVSCGAPAVVADHILRRRDGGKDDLSNLRSLCRVCDNKFKEKWDGERRGG